MRPVSRSAAFWIRSFIHPPKESLERCSSRLLANRPLAVTLIRTMIAEFTCHISITTCAKSRYYYYYSLFPHDETVIMEINCRACFLLSSSHSPSKGLLEVVGNIDTLTDIAIIVTTELAIMYKCFVILFMYTNPCHCKNSTFCSTLPQVKILVLY